MMAEVSALARQLSRLVTAAGWRAESSRFKVDVLEPAFEPVRHTWMAGQARAMSDEEILRVRPSRVIVEEGAPLDQITRISDLLDASDLAARVGTYSHFADDFWEAGRALSRALRDASTSDTDFDLDEPTVDANLRHVEQLLDFDSNTTVTDHRAFDLGLPDIGTCLAILADAGLGKSELLRWQEWRYASTYATALRGSRNIELPPIALRLSLRDMRSLSLDYIAHALSQPDSSVDGLALRMINSGGMLRELLIQKRLILFLDGLDEMALDSAGLDAGLLAWRRVVAEGARFVVSSRTGLASVHGVLSRRFSEDEIARLRPMESHAARELLEKRGTSSERARTLVNTLHQPSSGIPLFVLLAKAVDLDTAPSIEDYASRTHVLQRLLELFCERDSNRLGVPGETQMDLLTQVAEWLSVEDSLTPAQLLENLGLDPTDPLSRVITNPHALLMITDDSVRFKFQEFGALFTARSLVESWQRYGFSSVLAALRRRKLDQDVVEFAARLLPAATLAGAWLASVELVESPLLLRRNLLAIALAKIEDTHSAEPPSERSVRLAALLGERSISRASIAGLTFQRFDFDGWSFRSIASRDGLFSYCINLWRSDRDNSLGDAEVDGCDFSPPQDEKVDVGVGVARLKVLVRPLRRRNGRGLTSIMAVNEARDPQAWEKLVHLHFASRSGRANASIWTLTTDGLAALTAFSSATTAGDDAIRELMATDAQIRTIVDSLSQ